MANTSSHKQKYLQAMHNYLINPGRTLPILGRHGLAIRSLKGVHGATLSYPHRPASIGIVRVDMLKLGQEQIGLVLLERRIPCVGDGAREGEGR